MTAGGAGEGDLPEGVPPEFADVYRAAYEAALADLGTAAPEAPAVPEVPEPEPEPALQPAARPAAPEPPARPAAEPTPAPSPPAPPAPEPSRGPTRAERAAQRRAERAEQRRAEQAAKEEAKQRAERERAELARLEQERRDADRAADAAAARERREADAARRREKAAARQADQQAARQAARQRAVLAEVEREVDERPTRQRTPRRPDDPDRVPVLPVLGLLAGLGLVMAAVSLRSPDGFGMLLAVGAAALAAVVVGLSNPVACLVLMLLATMFRLSIPYGPLPTDPFVVAFAGLVLSVALKVRTGALRVRIGPLEVAVALYLLWNVASMLAQHTYASSYPQFGVELPVGRFILIGVAMPLLLLLVARTAFTRAAAVRVVVLALLVMSAYVAAVTILPTTPLAPLTFPRYILTAPNDTWPGRALGVFLQPAVNGIALIVGYLVAVFVASLRREATWLRWAAVAVAGACCYGVYLTQTRANWLALGIVVVVGALVARGWRRGFAITLVLMVLGVAANWARFTSSDRAAGGVTSTSELEDRLNVIATALWAIDERPLTGWGIGRFAAVNTYHHQQWSPEVPWDRGFGIASHFDALGVAAELGLFGLGLWLVVMGTIITLLVRSVRGLPEHDPYGRPFATLAALTLTCLLVIGLTLDLRFFDYANFIVMLLVGCALGLHDRARDPGPDPASDPVRGDAAVGGPRTAPTRDPAAGAAR